MISSTHDLIQIIQTFFKKPDRVVSRKDILTGGSLCKPIRFILICFGTLFCLIATSAFILSYSNLTAVAKSAGIPEIFAPLWPLCLDSFLVAGSIFILRASLLNESTRQGWVILILFTGVSTGFNITQGPQNFLSNAAHAIPPIALCADLEMFMYILKSDLKRFQPIFQNSENAETTEKTLTDEERVLKCIKDHPRWNRNMVAIETGCDYRKVNQIFAEIKPLSEG